MEDNRTKIWDTCDILAWLCPQHTTEWYNLQVCNAFNGPCPALSVTLGVETVKGYAEATIDRNGTLTLRRP